MDKTGRVWTVYPGDIPGSGYLELSDNPVFVESIQWSGYDAVTDVVDVKDRKDREVFFREGLTSLEPLEVQTGGEPFMGLRVYSLTAGMLQIYIR